MRRAKPVMPPHISLFRPTSRSFGVVKIPFQKGLRKEEFLRCLPSERTAAAGRWYDPFCPKILGILGKTKLPRTIASRSIILRMWPKKPDEKTEDFAYADDPEFSTIRRKLARWASDNVRIIKDLKPPQPPGFARLNCPAR